MCPCDGGKQTAEVAEFAKVAEFAMASVCLENGSHPNSRAKVDIGIGNGAKASGYVCERLNGNLSDTEFEAHGSTDGHLFVGALAGTSYVFDAHAGISGKMSDLANGFGGVNGEILLPIDRKRRCLCFMKLADKVKARKRIE